MQRKGGDLWEGEKSYICTVVKLRQECRGVTAGVGVISKGTGGGMSVSWVSFSWELGTPRSFSYTLPLVGVLRRAAGLRAAPLLSSFRHSHAVQSPGLGLHPAPASGRRHGKLPWEPGITFCLLSFSVQHWCSVSV